MHLAAHPGRPPWRLAASLILASLPVHLLRIMRQGLLGIALLSVVMSTPSAMAKTCGPMQMAATEQAVSHRSPDDAQRSMPAKQLHCMGACVGLPVGTTNLPDRSIAPAAAALVLAASCLSGISSKADTPPPRPALG